MMGLRSGGGFTRPHAMNHVAVCAVRVSVCMCRVHVQWPSARPKVQVWEICVPRGFGVARPSRGSIDARCRCVLAARAGATRIARASAIPRFLVKGLSESHAAHTQSFAPSIHFWRALCKFLETVSCSAKSFIVAIAHGTMDVTHFMQQEMLKVHDVPISERPHARQTPQTARQRETACA